MDDGLIFYSVGNGVSAVADSFSCTNCCERFSLTEAESHFRTVMHFNGNLVKCGSCEDMTGAKVKSYKEFLTYKKNHQCRQKVWSLSTPISCVCVFLTDSGRPSLGFFWTSKKLKDEKIKLR